MLLLADTPDQARSQDLKKGGWGFFERPWPEFSLLLKQNHTVSPKLRRFFSPKTGDLKTKKKKGLHQNWDGFSGRITATTSQLRHPNSFGLGAVFIFSTQIGLKSTKNVRFCILCRPMGARSPLATLLPLMIPITGETDCRIFNFDVYCVMLF